MLPFFAYDMPKPAKVPPPPPIPQPPRTVPMDPNEILKSLKAHTKAVFNAAMEKDHAEGRKRHGFVTPFKSPDHSEAEMTYSLVLALDAALASAQLREIGRMGT